MNLFFAFAFLLFTTVEVSFAQAEPRFQASCGYLTKGIYCFGGSTMSGTSSVSDFSIKYLEIVNSSNITAKDLEAKWVTLTSKTNGLNLPPRNFPQYTALPDGKTMLLSGGSFGSDSTGTSQTIAYDIESNSWTEYPSYTEPPFGVRQIFRASSVYVPDYGVGYYGGIETNINHNWTHQGSNMSLYDDSNGTRRWIGYTSLTFLDIRKTENPWFIFPNQNNLPAGFYRDQKSIFDSENNQIYFFGGMSGKIATYSSFASSIVFNTKSGAWGTQELSGNPPSERYFHSITLLQSTNRDVLLYGGENNKNGDRVSLDYCFTLNLDTHEWKQQYITAPDNTELIRTRHSAVSIDSNTLFIVFGKSQIDIALSSIVMLNVTDPLSISYLNAYTDPNAKTNPTDNSHLPGNSESINNSKSNGNTGLSTGAIAGIAVGVVVAASIIIVILFCLRKKNINKKKQELVEEHERTEEPVIEVDWEEIDKKYESYNPNLTNNPAYFPRLIDDSVTDVDDKSTGISKNLMLKPDSIAKLQNPDAILQPTMLQKPYSDH